MNTKLERPGILSGSRIVVGVTGSVAAYKSAALVSMLVRHGALVDVILSTSGARFVTPTTFSALTKGEVLTELFNDEGIPHIRLAKRSDLIIVAPATANTIGRIANGITDDLLLLTILGTRSPIVIAPAMEEEMWLNPATQRNIATLTEDGMLIAGPVSGRHASGAFGTGRMMEPDALIGYIRQKLGSQGDLTGYRCLVTAGGTREALDPVRMIGNRSSGKMGVALARAARDRGAQVTLVTTSSFPPDDAGFNMISVESSSEMKNAVNERLGENDVLLMAAAVADYRPVTNATKKIKKEEKNQPYQLKLEPTEDIVADAAKSRSNGLTNSPKVIVSFAAETEQLEYHAQKKLRQKGVDMVIGNLVSTGKQGNVFGSDFNKVILVMPDTEPIAFPAMEKEQVAHHIFDAVINLLNQSN